MNEYEYELDRDNGLNQENPQTPAQARLIRDASLYPDVMTVTTTDDDFESTTDVYGVDVVDTGMSSDASLGGLGVDLDSLPGDETPISR